MREWSRVFQGQILALEWHDYHEAFREITRLQLIDIQARYFEPYDS
jgi:hypothetical protein